MTLLYLLRNSLKWKRGMHLSLYIELWSCYFSLKDWYCLLFLLVLHSITPEKSKVGVPHKQRGSDSSRSRNKRPIDQRNSGTLFNEWSRVYFINVCSVKAQRKKRPVWNSRWINKHMERVHFKMENLGTIRDTIIRGNWMVLIDLKDAYFHVPVGRELQQYLQFKWRNQVYCFRCIPFGISSAPSELFKYLEKDSINGILEEYSWNKRNLNCCLFKKRTKNFVEKSLKSKFK